MKSLINLKLTHEEQSPRTAQLISTIQDDKLASMVIIWKGTNKDGLALFSMANMPDHTLMEDPKLGNWRYMRPLFPLLTVGQAYHFLCHLKNKTYLPLLLVEQLDADLAGHRSKSMYRLTSNQEAYLNRIGELNERWLTNLKLANAEAKKKVYTVTVEEQA